MEVTLGTFLHMVHFPFSGSILSACAAGLLVAGARLCPAPGFPIRAALVAATCRALLPAGLIIPPLIAITMEGVVVALALRVLGNNLIGALVAGVLATTWSLSQKLLAQFLFYGGTLVDLYVALARQGGELFGLEPATFGLAVVGGLLAITWGFGVTGGVLGYLVARRFPAVTGARVALTAGALSGGAAVAAGRGRSVAPALAVAVPALTLQAFRSVWWGLLGLLLILAYVLLFERRVLRRMGRLRFWVASLALALLSGLLLGDRTASLAGVPFSPSGLAAGGLMFVRLTTFLLAIGAVAARLDRERVLALFARLGLPGFGRVLTVAVELLPTMVAAWTAAFATRDAAGRRPPLTLRVAKVLQGAARLAGELAEAGPTGPADGARARPALFVVTGPVGSGKTTLLRTLATAAAAGGLEPAGFLQERVGAGGGPADYDLVLLGGGERLPLLRRAPDGSPRFAAAAWPRAAAALPSAPGAPLWIVDELGREEAAGAGHLPALRAALERGGPQRLVASVRLDQRDALLAHLAPHTRLARVLTLPAAPAERAAFVEAVGGPAAEADPGDAGPAPAG
jgi:nucleoside-triphosphatase THEP1